MPRDTIQYRCQHGAACVSTTKYAAKISIPVIVEQSLVCQLCQHLFCPCCKDRHHMYCDRLKASRLVQYDLAALKAQVEPAREQIKADNSRKRYRPKEWPSNMQYVYVSLVKLLGFGSKTSAVQTINDALQDTVEDLIVTNVDYGSSCCKRCNLLVDLCCYKDEAPSKESVLHDVYCLKCAEQARRDSAKNLTLVRLASVASLEIVKVFLTDCEVSHNLSYAKLGEVEPIVLPGRYLLNEQATRVKPFDFNYSDLQHELEILDINELENLRKEHLPNVGEGASRQELVKQLLTQCKQGAYLAFNPLMLSKESILAKLNDRIREGDYKAANRGITDKLRTSLVLVGGAKCGTRWHVDWTEAVNVCYPLPGAKALMPLSWWSFIHPSAAKDAATWLSNNVSQLRGKGFTSEAKEDRVTEQQARELVHALGCDAKGNALARMVYQHAGDAVVVPPGWLHTVGNVQACIKLAYDKYVPKNFPAYMDSWAHISTVYTVNNARDYMGMATVLFSEVLRFYEATGY